MTAAAGPAAPAGRGGGGGADSFGFYLPFNWRGFYDFGTGLIGDWGVHILGPANWALQLHPRHLTSVECINKNALPPFTFPDELTIKYEFAARDSMPPVTVYWYHKPSGDAYLPPGMTAERAQDRRQRPAGRTGSGGGGGAAGAAGSGWSQATAGGQAQVAAASRRRGAAATTASSSAPKATWEPAAAAKASACCPASAGPNTSCPSRILSRVARRQHGQQPRRACPRLDSRLQRRRARLLQLQHRRAVHRMARAWRHRRSL